MLAGITYRQFREWQLYERRAPFGSLREDERAALICCMLSSQKAKPSDFFPVLRWNGRRPEEMPRGGFVIEVGR